MAKQTKRALEELAEQLRSEPASSEPIKASKPSREVVMANEDIKEFARQLRDEMPTDKETTTSKPPPSPMDEMKKRSDAMSKSIRAKRETLEKEATMTKH